MGSVFCYRGDMYVLTVELLFAKLVSKSCGSCSILSYYCWLQGAASARHLARMTFPQDFRHQQKFMPGASALSTVICLPSYVPLLLHSVTATEKMACNTEASATHIDALPTDCLAHILGQLLDVRDVAAAQRASKRFVEAAKLPVAWQQRLATLFDVQLQARLLSACVAACVPVTMHVALSKPTGVVQGNGFLRLGTTEALQAAAATFGVAWRMCCGTDHGSVAFLDGFLTALTDAMARRRRGAGRWTGRRCRVR